MLINDILLLVIINLFQGSKSSMQFFFFIYLYLVLLERSKSFDKVNLLKVSQLCWDLRKIQHLVENRRMGSEDLEKDF